MVKVSGLLALNRCPYHSYMNRLAMMVNLYNFFGRRDRYPCPAKTAFTSFITATQIPPAHVTAALFRQTVTYLPANGYHTLHPTTQ